MHPVTDTEPPRGRVLTVDDSAVMRVLVSASLEALGYSVEAVDSGHAALEAWLLRQNVRDVECPVRLHLPGCNVGYLHRACELCLIAIELREQQPEQQSRVADKNVVADLRSDVRRKQQHLSRLRVQRYGDL